MQHYFNVIISMFFFSSQRGMDSLSMRSSDSDVSDMSAMSSTSRLSSTSHMSVQSERVQASRRIR